jgi:hypothetical protein
MVYLDDAYVQIAPEEYKSYQENVRNAHEYLHSGQMDMSGWVEQPQKINERIADFRIADYYICTTIAF